MDVIYQNWDAALQILEGKWNNPPAPVVYCGSTTAMNGTAWNAAITRGVWQKLTLNFIAPNTFDCYVNQTLISTATVCSNQGRTNNWTVTLENFDGDIDEVRLINIFRTPAAP